MLQNLTYYFFCNIVHTIVINHRTTMSFIIMENIETMVRERHKQQCLGDMSSYQPSNWLHDNIFEFPSCGHNAMSKMFHDPAKTAILEPMILKKAVVIYNTQNTPESKQTSTTDPPGLNEECQQILFRRTLNKMANDTTAALKSKPPYLPTTFTLKNGCCNQKDCPKYLFVKAIIMAISEIARFCEI